MVDEGTNRFGMTGYGSSTYGDSFADVYDDWYSDLADDDFVATVLAHLPTGPARVLDLGTGTGRLLERIAATRGDLALVGVDASEAMLGVARARASLATAHLSHHDFSVSLPDGPFHVVMAGYNTLFNLPDDAALSSCLGLVAASLADDGRFVVDCVMPPRDGGGDHVGVRSIGADEVVLSVSRHDPATGRIVGQFVHFRATSGDGASTGAGMRLRPWSVRYVAPERLDEMASAHGLRLESRRGDGANGAPATRHVSTYSRTG